MTAVTPRSRPKQRGLGPAWTVLIGAGVAQAVGRGDLASAPLARQRHAVLCGHECGVGDRQRLGADEVLLHPAQPRAARAAGTSRRMSGPNPVLVILPWVGGSLERGLRAWKGRETTGRRRRGVRRGREVPEAFGREAGREAVERVRDARDDDRCGGGRAGAARDGAARDRAARDGAARDGAARDGAAALDPALRRARSGARAAGGGGRRPPRPAPRRPTRRPGPGARGAGSIGPAGSATRLGEGRARPRGAARRGSGLVDERRGVHEARHRRRAGPLAPVRGRAGPCPSVVESEGAAHAGDRGPRARGAGPAGRRSRPPARAPRRERGRARHRRPARPPDRAGAGSGATSRRRLRTRCGLARCGLAIRPAHARRAGRLRPAAVLERRARKIAGARSPLGRRARPGTARMGPDPPHRSRRPRRACERHGETPAAAGIARPP